MKFLKFNSLVLIGPSILIALIGFFIPLKLAISNEQMLGIYVIELPISLIIYNIITLNISGYVLSKNFHKSFNLNSMHVYALIGTIIAIMVYFIAKFSYVISLDFNILLSSVYSIYFFSLSSYYQYERKWNLFFIFSLMPPLLIYLPWLVLCFGGNLDLARFICNISAGVILVVFLVYKKVYHFYFSIKEFKDLLSYSLPLVMFSSLFGIFMNWDRLILNKLLTNLEWIIYSKHLIVFSIGSFAINLFSLVWGDVSFKMLSNNISIFKRCLILSIAAFIFGFIFFLISYYGIEVFAQDFSADILYLTYITIITTLLFIRTIWQTYLQYFRNSLIVFL